MKGKTILLIEDNAKVMRNNANMLKRLGVTVLSAETLNEARLHLKNTKPDAVVLDIMLPDGSGLNLLKEIRSAHGTISALPVLLLTAKRETEDILYGFSVGADDYVSKPYPQDILRARLEALIRRSDMQAPKNLPDIVNIGILRFDLVSQQVFIKSNDLLLTKKEFALLYYLAQNEGIKLTANDLYEKVWGLPSKEDTSAVRNQMSNLKKKLNDETDEIAIETTWGGGYCMEFQKKL